MWYFKHQGRLQGPIPTADMHEYLRHGVITRETLVTREGEGCWNPIHLTPELCQIIAPRINQTDPAIVARSGSPHDRRVYWEYLQEVGRSQRAMLLVCLAAFPIRLIPIALAFLLSEPLRWIVVSLVDVITVAVLAAFVNRLATSMRLAAWPWIVGLCVPLAWFPILWQLHERATRIMRAAGMPVGMFGAKDLQSPPAGLL